MQKAALLIESVMIGVLLGMVVWQRYQRPIKGWWKQWRAAETALDAAATDTGRLSRLPVSGG
jgi:hypothetical protein